MYRGHRSGGSMIWMSLSRTLKVPCAMSHLRERAVRREHIEPVEGARESAYCDQACGSERYVRTPALSKAGRSQSEVTRAARAQSASGAQFRELKIVRRRFMRI